ncbi:MAG: HD domain-containing protein [Candidatus Thorarchaeota archaeon]
MDVDEIISLCLRTESLKRLPRTGWVITGVNLDITETIASHIWGTTFVSLLIASHLESTGVNVDIGLVLKIATLHDLSESITSDIPRSAVSFFGDDAQVHKERMEISVLETLFENLPQFRDLVKSVSGFISDSSLESRIVKVSDILDMLFHASSLERAGASPDLLDEFFTSSKTRLEKCEIEIAEAIFHQLYSEHCDMKKRYNTPS